MTIWTPVLGTRPGPRYRAIADAIGRDVSSGRLAEGTRLPTHRALADELGVTVGTVSRAYAEAARRGLLSGEVGRGTFVRGAPAPLPAVRPRPDGLIDLSVNHPPVTPRERGDLKKALTTLARQPDLSTLAAYQPEVGAARHREAGARWIRRAGLDARADDVLVCSGGQHAMAVVLSTLLEPGDLVLTESLTYPGVKTLASLLRLRVQGLPMDAHGLRPDALETAARAGTARALYCLPTLHNPTTTTMPEERRREIAELARKHGLAVIEDDIHGLLPPERPRPLAAFAPEVTYYITSTSKFLAPGLRIAYLLSPPGMADRLGFALRATTWMAPPLSAEIATLWINDGTADAILQAKRQEARARQELAGRLLGRLERQADPFAYHLWLTLPEPWRSATFAARARHAGVGVAPAEVFVVGRAGAPHAVRISLGAAKSRDELERALRSLLATLQGPAEAGLAIV